ncbi:MAG TPA: dihydroneopterin aldolase [Gemmatimonadaceae bacterium]|nr:dihydroneopterin aldolase [Gemmatimonadaceae bacterium]
MSREHVVTLKAMRFHTHIGVLRHESEIAQSIEVDVSVFVAALPGPDMTEGIVDYRRLYGVVADVVAGGHIRYLEELVDRIAENALTIAGVSRVQVSARKPHVALPGPLMHAEVSVDRAGG